MITGVLGLSQGFEGYTVCYTQGLDHGVYYTLHLMPPGRSFHICYLVIWLRRSEELI
jgi:hypothetical protein